MPPLNPRLIASHLFCKICNNLIYYCLFSSCKFEFVMILMHFNWYFTISNLHHLSLSHFFTIF